MTRTSRDALVMNGINNHPHQRAELDFYATEPKQARLLLGIEDLSGARILEPCCGTGCIAQVLTEAGLEVEASDIADRGFGRQQDFFTIPSFDGHIVTNPPFTRAVDFVSHALSIIPEGRKACFFLKLTFLEGIKRRHFFDITPPKRIHVSSSRAICAPNGDFASVKGSAIAYAWFVWEKGFRGKTTLDWYNPNP